MMGSNKFLKNFFSSIFIDKLHNYHGWKSD
jgi:hypothetical protein